MFVSSEPENYNGSMIRPFQKSIRVYADTSVFGGVFDQEFKVPSKLFFDAAFNGKSAIVGKALKEGINPNLKDPNGRTALMLAAFNGHQQVAKLLIEAGAQDSADNNGRTALMFASTGPYPGTVKLLLQSGSKVNRIDGHEGWTALMFAASEGQIDVVKLLIKHGAKITIKDTDGDTAESFARQRGHLAVANLLATLKK